MPEIEKEIMVVNKPGIHARPAAALVQCVLAFESEVYIAANGAPVNAKSIMGLLTLAATRGTRLTVMCRGNDAYDAMKAVESLFASGFGEE
jgi:phosphocarrier protein HPr